MPLGSKLGLPRGQKLEHRNKERKFQNSSSLKLEGLEVWYLVCSISLRTSTKFVHMMPLGSKPAPPRGHKLEHRNKEAHLQKIFSLKLDGVEIWYLVCGISLWTSTKFVHKMPLRSKLALPWVHIYKHRNKAWKFHNSFTLKLEGLELWYFVCNIS